MLKLNRGYLKTNAMYTARFDCKDIALNHTRNILKRKSHFVYINKLHFLLIKLYNAYIYLFYF